MSAAGADASLTRRFVDVLADWPAEGAELEARCRLLMLDGLAVAAAGARERGPSLMAELVRGEGREGPATVIGQGFAAPPIAAARVNGMAMHVLDFEPMWNPPNHALSPLLPALLALAEQRERDGAGPQGLALLRGIAKGIEAQGRLRLASGQIEPAKNTYHPPGVVGPVATALGCASLLGLDRAPTVMAVGIAASRAGGLLANVGSMTKALHSGDAAAHGLEAALLAARGFTADPDALGDPRGWGKSLFGADFDPRPLLAPVSVLRALAPGPSWKLFPSQFATHFAITAALEARAAIGGERISERVRRIKLRAPEMPYIDRPRPATGLDGKFSWQYTSVLALLDGSVGPSSFTDERRFAPDVEAMLGCLELVSDPEIPGRFDRLYVEIAVELANGESVKRRCSAPLGSWTCPIGAERIEAKARGLLTEAVGSEAAEAVSRTLAAPATELSARVLLQSLGGQGKQPCEPSRGTVGW